MGRGFAGFERGGHGSLREAGNSPMKIERWAGEMVQGARTALRDANQTRRVMRFWIGLDGFVDRERSGSFTRRGRVRG